MVLLSPLLASNACLNFEANIYLLYHANRISKKFQVTVHIGNVCQTATIINMDKESLRTNERANVKFKFNSRPEYLSVGKRFIFREGTTKGLGQITRIDSLNTIISDNDLAVVPL
jgi:GTPase